MSRARTTSGGFSVGGILNLVLNAIGVGAILWWIVASWRLHSIHAPDAGSEPAVRVGKGKKHRTPPTAHAPAPPAPPAPALADAGSKQLLPGVAQLVGESSGTALDTRPPFWVFCSTQWAECWCAGDIRWGNEETWHVIQAKPGSEINTVTCSIDHLPDVVPGDDGKHCECLVTPGTELYKNLNPMIMDQEDADHLGATVVASCELFFEARKNQPADLAQWLAVEGLCSAAWEEKTRFNRSLKAGPREISLEMRQHLMRARVDARFKSSMARFTEKGWFRHAWVTFVAGNPSSPFVKMAEELIKSVHYFSSWPILVYNFGFAAPETWTPERFPQLVIIHAAPLPSDPHIRRSFNFNKLRSILMARVLTGVQVDVDQFVAPGADILFDLTQKWVNKEYPFPLLPAHFLDWSIKDQPNAPWWPRYCPDPEKPCPMQTMRWAHAHPTWSYWALPFFGRWVRRHFRDERLPNVTVQGFQAAALRVGDVMEDEDLLNVALWEERANKQWCKFDVPATVEFESLLSWKSSDGHRCIHGIGCENIGGDKRWYLNGVPKVYWTAHHAVEPDLTAKYLERIRTRHKAGKWPAAIVYDGRFWESGGDLHKDRPNLQCLT
ncbi:unnamed protein product [Effrenium voratum]|uniref:Uncharacterized protein n=1 Tax=Effrenium voratum TaxID=2562239 RepID=A0AA36J6K9_9DINO|nr:unnamed protein product [Effrenium voratum]